MTDLPEKWRKRIEEIARTTNRELAYVWYDERERRNAVDLAKEVASVVSKETSDEVRTENDLLRSMLANLTMKYGTPCHYCGKENIAECPHGFPGCSLADDIMVGDSEVHRLLLNERDEARRELREAEEAVKWVDTKVSHLGRGLWAIKYGRIVRRARERAEEGK